MQTTDYEKIGKHLRSVAHPMGNFIEINVPNVYDLLETLSHFFVKRRHEWLAICFLNELFACNLIWINKGPSHMSVLFRLTFEEILDVALREKTKYVLIAHNHPISLSAVRGSPIETRREGILEYYDLKNQLFNFSDVDNKSGNQLKAYLEKANMFIAEAIYVSKDYKLEGYKKIVDNFKTNKSLKEKACLVSSFLFGDNGPETVVFKSFRDLYLTDNVIGKKVCDAYYFTSPYIVKWLSNKRKLKTCTYYFLRALSKMLIRFN